MTSAVGSDTLHVVVPGTVWHIGWQRLGVAVITDSLRWAAFGILGAETSPGQVQRIHEAMVFITGTGLDIAIDTFDLPFHADDLREAFHRWMKHHKTPYVP